MLQIEWESSVSKSDAILNLPSFDSPKLYHSDGRRRSRPKASTVHGWLVKWRATFSGDERLRKEGIREMREAKAVREHKKKKRAARLAKAGVSKPFFCLWPISLGKKRQPRAPKGLSRVSQRSSTKRTGHEGIQHQASPSHSPRPTPTNSRRSSRNRQGTGDGTPRSSRKLSHDSRRNALRAAERKP